MSRPFTIPDCWDKRRRLSFRSFTDPWGTHCEHSGASLCVRMEEASRDIFVALQSYQNKQLLH